MICGERGHGDYLRNPEKNAWIEAVFSCESNPELENWLKEQDVESEEGLYILSREIRKDGRSVARLNGRVVSLALLKEAAAFFLDLHGQNDRQKLLDPRWYLSYVDSFLPAGQTLAAEVAEAFSRWQQKVREKEKLKLDESERLQRLDFLRYQINEIEKAGLQEGEEAELIKQRDRIQNAETLAKSSRRINDLLFYGEGAAVDENIYRAMETAKHLAEEDFFKELAIKLESIYYELQEQKYQLNDFQSHLDFEPGRLEEIEERLYLIRTLEKKYGAEIPDVLENYRKMVAQQEILENITGHAEKLEMEIQQLFRDYQAKALELRAERCRVKTMLEESVRQELKDLNLPHLRFEIQIIPREMPAKTGMDEAAFLFSANPGEPLRPLQKIASGGELSRFTLALKIALAERYRIETIVLDEIDAGLGGMAQRSMAVKLWAFSRKRQLMLVTHAAQIASFAEKHFLITKEVRGDKTYSTTVELNDEQRIRELARMLDGDAYSGVSLEHARQLLAEARKK